MCKTNENIKKELEEKLSKTSNPVAKEAIEERLKKLSDGKPIEK